jgi:hypothetical protein
MTPSTSSRLSRMPSGKKSSVFRLGAKTFTLSFDGGWVAPYQIKEQRGRFQSSLWLKMFGLKWLLGVIEQVRLKDDKKGFFQFLRSNYSILEVSCLTNKGGRFLEVADYHSGAQRGSIRIPLGSRGTRWVKLATELGSFFLGREEMTLVPTKPEATLAGGVPIRSAKALNGKSRFFGSSRDPHASNLLVAPITPSANLRDNCFNSNSWVLMDLEAPRPTRRFVFDWKPHSKTLRITKNIGEARQAHWIPLKHKAVGLAQQSNLVKAQPVSSNTLDPGLDNPILKVTDVNVSTLVVEDSRLNDLRWVCRCGSDANPRWF